MTSCVRCGHELGIGRFCLNCGHPVGEPLPAEEPLPGIPEDASRPDKADRERPSWLPWAIGAVLIVILLAILASCLDGADDPAEDITATTVRTTPKTQAPPARAVDLTRAVKVSAPPAAPPTTDLDGQPVSFGPRLMLDEMPSTAWRTVGDATGQTLTFTLSEASTVRRVGLINGYARQVPSGTSLVDWYPNNRRITVVEWFFDDGTVVRQDLSEKSKLQRLTIDPETTTNVHLRVLGVTPPGVGVLGRDYTAISEILIAGTPVA